MQAFFTTVMHRYGARACGMLCKTTGRDCYLGSSLLWSTLALLHQLVPLLLLKHPDQFWLVLPHQAHLD